VEKKGGKINLGEQNAVLDTSPPIKGNKSGREKSAQPGERRRGIHASQGATEHREGGQYIMDSLNLIWIN